MNRLCALVGLLGLAVGAFAQADDAMVSTVLTSKEAVFAMLPELAVAPFVVDYAWSPDGRYVLAVRQDAMRIDLKRMAEGRLEAPPDTPAASLVLYDLMRHESTTLMGFPSSGRLEFSLGFTRTPGVAFVLATRTPVNATDEQDRLDRVRYLLVRVSATDRKASVCAELRFRDLGVRHHLVVSPASAYVVLHGAPYTPTTQGEPLIAFDSAGKRVASCMGGEAKSALWRFDWSEDGARLFAEKQPYGPNPVKEVVAFSLPGLQESKIVGQPKLYKEVTPPDLVLQTANQSIALAGVKKETSSLWLCSKEPTKEPSALIGTSCWDGQLSPNGSAVAFVLEGALFVRPLQRIDLAAYLAAKQEAEKAVALSNAKQVGLGIIMYSDDHDGQLPDAGSFIALVQPYLRNQSVFDGFHYTYQGDRSWSKIAEPTTTEMGYVDGPGGRAVVYADGHAKWVPNP